MWPLLLTLLTYFAESKETHARRRKYCGHDDSIAFSPPPAPNRESGQTGPPQKIKSGSLSPPVIIELLSARAASAAASCLAATSLRFLSCERLGFGVGVGLGVGFGFGFGFGLGLGLG